MGILILGVPSGGSIAPSGDNQGDFAGADFISPGDAGSAPRRLSCSQFTSGKSAGSVDLIFFVRAYNI
jgi:hypothetical protein